MKIQLNFSVKKAYEDLVLDKKYFGIYIVMSITFVALIFLATYFKIKILSVLCCIIYYGYLSLIANNVVKDKYPTLDNFLSTKEKLKELLQAGAKFSILVSIYNLLSGFIIQFVASALMVNFSSGFISVLKLAMIISSPVVIFNMITPSILFFENLSFKEAFNLKKAMYSFKYAAKEYILLVSFLIITGLAIITLPPNIIRISNLNLYVIFLVLLTIAFVFSFGMYFYTHLLAQSCKYSLSKMNKVNVAEEISSEVVN